MGSAGLLLALALSGGQPHPIDLGQYMAAVHSVRLSLDRAAQSPDLRSLSRIQGELRSLRVVRLPDGRIVYTDLPLLAADLSPTYPTSVRFAAVAVDALDSQLRSAPRRAVDSATLRSLDSVLKDSRFHPARPPWAPITDKIEELRRQLLTWLLSAERHSFAETGVFAVFLLLLVAGFGYLLARGALARMVVDAATEDEAEQPGTSAKAEERAQESASVGDYRQALRFLFLATMLALQEQGALELRPGMTNREYLRVVRDFRPGNEELQRALHSLVDTFEDTWYGHLPFGAQDFDRCRRFSAQILRVAAEKAA